MMDSSATVHLKRGRRNADRLAAAIDVDDDREVRTDGGTERGGWPDGDPCPECGDLMDVGAVGNPGESITWQQCDDCRLGWGPFTGYVDLDDDPDVLTDGGRDDDLLEVAITGLSEEDVGRVRELLDGSIRDEAIEVRGGVGR